MNAIETTGLTKRFRGRTAVDDLNLTIAQGEFFALLGQNGAGKTTTIRMLTCLLAPSAGDALLMGESIARNAEAAKAHSNLSPQETAIAQNLTVRENLMLIARLYGANKADATGQAEAAMRKFGLSARARDRAKTLSGGMQRRLSIAMALITKPNVLFLDEPTLGLDVRAARALENHFGTQGQSDCCADDALLGRGRSACRPDRHHARRKASGARYGCGALRQSKRNEL